MKSLPLNRTVGPPYPDRHADLVSRCQQGERRAQYDLYQQYAKAMYNVCLRIINHDAEAEDVLQDAFIDAFGHINSFRGQSTFGAWLKQIVVNRAINHLRGRRLDLVNLDEQAGMAGSHEDGETGNRFDVADIETADDTDVVLEVERVRRVMAQLPEGYRVVLSLYLFEGYDHEEIGQVLGISEVTSRSQYLRGKKRLLELLTNNKNNEKR
ncbi:MAG: RNA polymerase sigma factor [Spirosoma sp.]|nr:RNA polymerase sigma factor [Spirosoma sp.]